MRYPSLRTHPGKVSRPEADLYEQTKTQSSLAMVADSKIEKAVQIGFQKCLCRL